jgi:arginyl-tRNA synthetase
MDEYRDEIARYLGRCLGDGALLDKLAECVWKAKNKDGSAWDFSVSVPRALNVGMPRPPKGAAVARVKPQEASERWQQMFGEISSEFPLIVEVGGGGSVHFHIRVSPERMMRGVLECVFDAKERYGESSAGAGKTVLVEYSSPNIAKPFHAGHLRSTIIGNVLRKVHLAQGFKVVGINYLGDWGKQYGLLAVGFKRHGNEEALLADPIKHLFDVYVRINADKVDDASIDEEARDHFRCMEDGDEEALALWRRFRELSIAKYREMYARLNVDFDVYAGESHYSLDAMRHVLDELEAKQVLEDSDGARVANLKAHKLGVVPVRKTDGTLLYIARDIAAALDRDATYAFDKCIYVVASQQDRHFQQLFKILELAGHADVAKRCVHVNFGMVRGMSTRSGNVVFLEQILDEAASENLKIMKANEEKFAQLEDPERAADIVGMSAVIVQDLKAKRHKDYTFDWNRMLQSIGDTGPYLQYAHVRIASIMRKADVPVTVDDIDYSALAEPVCAAIVSKVAEYPEVVALAARELEPSLIVAYSFELCHLLSTALAALSVKHAESPKHASARMLMFWAAKQTLQNAMQLCSLRVLDRM